MNNKQKIQKILIQLVDNGKIELGTESSKLLLELIEDIKKTEVSCLE